MTVSMGISNPRLCNLGLEIRGDGGGEDNVNLLSKRVNRHRKQVNIFRVDVHLFSTR